MAVNQNISQFKEHVQNLIALNQVQKAIDELILWIRSHTNRKEPLYEILIVSSNYRRLGKQFGQGLIPFPDYQLYTNRLLHQIFRLVEDIDSDDAAVSVAISDY